MIDRNKNKVKTRKISIEEVRAYKRIHRRGIYKKTTLRVGIFVASFLILTIGSYLGLNFGGLKKQATFNEKSNTLAYNEVKGEISEQAVAGEITGTQNKKKYSFVATNNRLEIPSLGVVGNIIYPGSESEVDKNLDKGIVHLPQSVLPGSMGTTVFTAHSSSAKWSYYRNIFATLNRLQPGSHIFLYKNSEVLVYKVTGQEVITPDAELIKDSRDKERIALVTCWPLGTTEKRLIIYGEKI